MTDSHLPAAKPSRTPWRGISVCLAVALASVGFAYYRAYQELNSIFDYHFIVRAFDEETRQTIDSVSLGWSDSRDNSRILPRGGPTTSVTSSGEFTLSGMAVGSLTFTVGKEGYEDNTITVKQGDTIPSVLEVPLKKGPIKAE